MTPEEKLLALIQQDKRQEAVVPQNPASFVPQGGTTAAMESSLLRPAGRDSEGHGIQNPEAVSLLKKSTTDMTAVGEAADPPKISLKTDGLISGGTPARPEPAEGASASELPQPSKKLKLAGVEEKVEVRSQKSEVRIQNSETGSQKVEAPAAPSLPGAGSEVYELKSKASSFSAPISFLTMLNRVMTVLIVGLIAVVFYGIMSIRPGIAQELSRQIEGAGSLAVVPQTIVEEEVPALDVYLEKVGSRSLFAAKGIARSGGSVVMEKAGAPKDFSLVAVSLDSSSPTDSMAIIKNKTDSKTYFVKLGQTVGSTDYVLERVLTDRIVLKQNKMEFELK